MHDASYLDFAPTEPGTCFGCGLSLWSAPQPGCTAEHGSLAAEQALADRFLLMADVIGDQIANTITEDTVGWSMTAIHGEDRQLRETFVPIADLRAVPFMELLISEDFVPARLRVYTGPGIDGLKFDIWTQEDALPDLLHYSPVTATA